MATGKDIKPQAKPKGEGRLRWVLGWIVLPGSLIAALFLTGVHVGARHPDMLLSRLLLRTFGAEAGVAAKGEAPRSKPRPGATPGEAFSYTTTLTNTQLEAIASKSLGRSVAELDCDYVCRAYSLAEHQVAIYAVDQCTLGPVLSSMPSLLVCSGKLEAPQAKPAAPGQDSPEPASN